MVNVRMTTNKVTKLAVEEATVTTMVARATWALSQDTWEGMWVVTMKPVNLDDIQRAINKVLAEVANG